MTGAQQLTIFSHRGNIYYTPVDPAVETSQPAQLPIPPLQPRRRRPHSICITRFPPTFVNPSPSAPECKASADNPLNLDRFVSRKNIKRLWHSVIPSRPSISKQSRAGAGSAPSPSRVLTLPSAMPSSASTASGRSGNLGGYEGPGVGLPLHRPSLVNNVRSASGRGGSATSKRSSVANLMDYDKPIASSNGMACYVKLAEPTLFLTGFDHVDGRGRNDQNQAAIVRGSLILHVTKSAKIKTITLKFLGKARTDWPEGMLAWFAEARRLY